MTTLRQQFAEDFSRTAFDRQPDGTYIMGKWGSITQLYDGSYDVWFTGRNLSPLSGQKLAAIRRRCPDWMELQEADGEAYAQGHTREFVLAAAELAGVRKKRQANTRPAHADTTAVA